MTTICVIFSNGFREERYRVPYVLARDLERWLRWAEKHGGVERETEQPELFPLRERVVAT